MTNKEYKKETRYFWLVKSGEYYYHVKAELNNELNKLLVHDNIKDWKPLEEVFNAKTFNEWLEQQPIWLKWKNYKNKNYKRCK